MTYQRVEVDIIHQRKWLHRPYDVKSKSTEKIPHHYSPRRKRLLRDRTRRRNYSREKKLLPSVASEKVMQNIPDEEEKE